MELLITASLITAFLAGLAALFAPCCIGVLLPAYFASVFRQRSKVLLMTFMFFLGLSAVFVPLGLGMGFLGELFRDFHNQIYIVGSVTLFILGATLLLGVHASMPFSSAGRAKVEGGGSVFMLGIFSGFATLCCAPVLAGALALSILPGSILWGGIYSIFYVIGMVSPLFVISLFVDKTRIMERVGLFRKSVTYRLPGKTVTIPAANLLSGSVFIIMSFLIAGFVMRNQTQAHTASDLNIMMARVNELIAPILAQAPFIGWVVVTAVLGGLAWLAFRAMGHSKKCAYCHVKIPRGEEVVADVKIIGYVGTYPTPFCSKEHAQSHTSAVEEHIKKQKPKGGCCG